MKIPFLDLQAQYDSIKNEIDTAVSEVIRSGHFIMGPNVKQFEEEMASYLGVKHAIAVANGTKPPYCKGKPSMKTASYFLFF
ncbi:DegT/DnrJ/EryC1/StrS aminotransferase family protein [Biomaibacter acetigenes]|uniref:DegT/DnrJ/EryC1/StrS aminotransferase family protein n=1 Tax=Biomaibacter acetigenes TaxID=2316383 RepID=A0A3G2R7R0_9FIRM|nr:DegT/DnrJ/EryC1/StrS family aminotransferase [Biomaibacter acetigenes]AYO31449.1 DegT/DnrJ/EryC1/StrS aminotransferase family protein [Biomaibacter acetigenes]